MSCNILDRDGHEDHDFEEMSKHYLKKREVSKMDGHDKKVDGHEDEFSQELMPYKHNLNKRGVARIDPMEFDINNEFELDAERVEMMPNEQVFFGLTFSDVLCRYQSLENIFLTIPG